MRRLRQRLGAFFTIAVAVVALVGFTPAVSANAEPSGQYDYECVASDGSSYMMKQGTKLLNCHGTFLKIYIGGKFIKSVALKTHGPVQKKLPAKGAWCTLAILGAGASAVGVVISGGAGSVVWLGAGGDILGVAGACLA